MKEETQYDRDYDLWVLLSRTYHVITRARDLELSHCGITREQAFTLFVIKMLGDQATPTAIAYHIYRQPNSVSELLKRMEKNGLITKGKNLQGKGRYVIRLTEKGQRACNDGAKRESIHRIMSILSDEQHQQVKSYLEMLRNQTISEITINKEVTDLPSELISRAISTSVKDDGL